MIRFFPGEEWTEITLSAKMRRRYAISNFGRLISFLETFQDGKLIKGGHSDGYKTFSYKYRVDKKYRTKSILIHNLVAKHFIQQPSDKHIHVIHLDHSRTNNFVDNLKWYTREEKTIHNNQSPLVVLAKKNVKPRGVGHKLNTTVVIRIKKMIFDPKRKTRMKMIAKQFGISEMQLYRIKSGENWGHVKID